MRKHVAWIAILFACVGVGVAVTAQIYSGALARERATNGLLTVTQDHNLRKMAEQQAEIGGLKEELEELKDGPDNGSPPEAKGPIDLRGSSGLREERQLETIAFSGRGELLVDASSRHWSEDTSVGMQIWQPKEDSLVFRGGRVRVVRNGRGVVDQPVPDWPKIRGGRHTYGLVWNDTDLKFEIDGKPVTTVPRGSLPSASTDFLIRFNADLSDTLTVHGYRASYTDASGRTITIP